MRNLSKQWKGYTTRNDSDVIGEPTSDNGEDEDIWPSKGTLPETELSEVSTSSCKIEANKAPIRKRKRVYVPEVLDIASYRNKPEIVLSLHFPLQMNVPPSFEKAVEADILWMINMHVSPMQTPLWTAWNSLAFTENTKFQKVRYLLQINQSRTKTAVVKGL